MLIESFSLVVPEGKHMQDLKLVLQFQRTGEAAQQVRGASRIKVDGRGVLLFDAQGKRSERIDIGSLRSFHLLGIPPANLPLTVPN